MRILSTGATLRQRVIAVALLAAGAAAATQASSAEFVGQRIATGPKVLVAAGTPAVPAKAAAPNGSAHPDTIPVTIDHAKVMRLPERTQTVIIGNPIVADVTVQKNGLLILTGKSYGVTNMIALDASGSMLAESFISVQAPTESLVTVQRGLERESYSCTPNCQPSLLLGDATKYFGEVSGQAGQRNTLATQK
jgi:Flp pilus assembly secretin CpaC